MADFTGKASLGRRDRGYSGEVMGESLLSVALCTYNGSKYLPDQLRSIAAQTRLPDELIIIDDQSADGTIEISEAFKNTANFPVQIAINPQNLGVTKNFERAISLCVGDIIVLSDQDDVWRPEKLSRILNEFSKFPEVGLVFSDAEMVDEGLNFLGCRLWERSGFHRAQQLQAVKGKLFSVLLQENCITGATMAFRSRFRQAILPIPASVVHDAWIGLIIAALAPAAIIPEPLIMYRNHENNQIGVQVWGFKQRLQRSFKSDANTFLQQAQKYELALERLSARVDSPLMPRSIKELIGKITHLKNRGQMRQKPMARFVLALQELLKLHYHHFSNGWASFAKDIFL
jgi:glycosyltransferase involved in cell wall biosynthesis